MTDDNKPTGDPANENQLNIDPLDDAISFNSEAAAEAIKKYLATNAIAREQISQMISAFNSSDAFNAARETMARASANLVEISKVITSSFSTMHDYFNSDEWKKLRESFKDILEFADEFTELTPYLEEELKKPEYEGKTIDDLFNEIRADDSEPAADSLLMRALTAARAARDEQATIDAQQAGRELRRQLRTNAEKQGAIMTLRNDALPVFSARDLWDAFAPGRISKMGKLSPDAIDKQTGRINKTNLDKGDIIPLTATEISYKAFMLLNAILANSVENFREYFISDGSITFYVKGVLDNLEIDPRIKDDMQLTLDRKTAGVLYLEKQFEPLLTFIGTTPDGSRYSVFSYDGYNVDSDTMTIRSPYLFRLWRTTQIDYQGRKREKEKSIAAGKKPLKSAMRPLEVNTLFKGTAYKEDDTVLEIATYITNVLLNAGKGAHKTEITFKTITKKCPRLHERLQELEKLPNTEKLPDGKRRNNSARYNSELRKIARAYSLIMNPEKCDALSCFEFKKFTPTREKDGKTELIPPTKSTLNEKIVIEWNRIDRD